MAERAPSPTLGDMACCSDLYQLPVVRMLLGDSWHPGGLALTRTLAKELKLTGGHRLLEVACGRGTSAIMLAQVYKCRVTGLDSDPAAAQLAREDARRYRLEGLATFGTADATALPFAPAIFDAALCECALSVFSDRSSALAEIWRVLRPGACFALSDVTFRPSAFPAPLDVPLASALCIPLGVGPEDYVGFLEKAGFAVLGKGDHSETILGLLHKVDALLGLGNSDPSAPQAAEAVRCARQLVEEGKLGYWTFLARKPED